MAKTLRELDRIVDEHHETLFGNSHPGLKDRMKDVERDSKDAKDFIEGIKDDLRKILIAVVGALFVMVIAAVCSMAFTSFNAKRDPGELRQIVGETVRAIQSQTP